MQAWEWAGHRRGRGKELEVSASLRCHRQEIDKFPAPPKKARVSYPLAAFATRKPALFCVPLVSENEGSRQSKIAPGGVYTCEGAQSLHEVATPPRVTDMVRPGGIWCYT